jgi:prepilin-type processing-associated H-X9-DG protein
VLGVGVGLLVLSGFLFGAEVPVTLLFGWISYLWRVVPRIRTDWPAVGVGAGAAVLFTLGVHWIGRSWRKAEPDAPAWKFRWSLTGVAMVVLAFAAGIAVVGVVHQTGWLMTAEGPRTGETVRRWSSNANNLRSIGIGLNSYACSQREPAFPPGGTFTPDGDMRHSWETHLLPYIGYSTKGIDFNRAWNDPVNQEPFKCVVPDFVNPDLFVPSLTDAEGYGLSHYAANSRVMAANWSLSPKDFPNGTTNTILIGEVNANFKPWAHPVNWRDPARGINRSPNGFGGPSGSGGANFVMADGSVRFISDQVSPEVLRALSSPRGRE